ncbi:hypothetical protein [Kitasatospora aureofaciens]|uniref:hypothetical protein n=1 Tax=Kitasatospora aureofaciens TaxID=1894 RepID=UPI003407E4ED
MDLLRWWRFLWALDIEWNHATRVDARDFTRWMRIADKPQRLHWRHRSPGQPGWCRGEAQPARSGSRAAYGRGPWHPHHAW